MVNHHLEQVVQAIIKSWFVEYKSFGGEQPEAWQEVALDSLTTLISRGITLKYVDESDQIIVNQKCIRNHTVDLSILRTHLPKIINEKG